MKLVLFTISLICLCNIQITAQEVNTRGKIVSIQPNTNDTIAFANATLILYSKIENKWNLLATTISDKDGIYYFENVKTGTYFVQVNKKKNFKIQIETMKNEELLDLPLIVY